MTLEERLERLEAEQRVIKAKQDIWHLMTRYARAVDENDTAELNDIFTDDVTSQSVPWSKHLQVGKARVVRSFEVYIATFEKPKRFLTNEQIEVVDATNARGWANWFAVQSHGGNSYYGWGFYEWDFRRCEDGVWRIARMIINLECMTTLERGWGDPENRVMAYPG